MNYRLRRREEWAFFFHLCTQDKPSFLDRQTDCINLGRFPWVWGSWSFPRFQTPKFTKNSTDSEIEGQLVTLDHSRPQGRMWIWDGDYWGWLRDECFPFDSQIIRIRESEMYVALTTATEWARGWVRRVRMHARWCWCDVMMLMRSDEFSKLTNNDDDDDDDVVVCGEG